MKRVHVIGPFNSGTNLLFNIMSNCECVELTTNEQIKIGDNVHDPFNKHTLKINDIDNYLKDDNNLLIIMYKEVYNWLFSIKKQSYDLKYTNLYLPVKFRGKNFKNVIDVYNYYYINYMNLIKKSKNVVFLDYKKVIDKNTSYNYINNELSKLNITVLSQPKFNIQLNTKSKTHGKPVKNSEEAKNSYNHNQIMVRKFITKIPILKKSINHKLESFYKT